MIPLPTTLTCNASHSTVTAAAAALSAVAWLSIAGVQQVSTLTSNSWHLCLLSHSNGSSQHTTGHSILSLLHNLPDTPKSNRDWHNVKSLYRKPPCPSLGAACTPTVVSHTQHHMSRMHFFTCTHAAVCSQQRHLQHWQQAH